MMIACMFALFECKAQDINNADQVDSTVSRLYKAGDWKNMIVLGQQAIDKIFERHREFPKSQVFSMAFLDYHMPVKDGLETTKEIVEMFREEGLIEFPIIACTAFGARDLVKNWTFFGVSDFVIKPVGFQKIEGILRNFKVLK